MEEKIEELTSLQNPKVEFEATFDDIQDYNIYLKAQDLTSVFTIVIYAISLSFLIFIFIVNKNQINDLKENINIESKIGYSKSQIKINLFKRILLLYTISFILSFILLPIIITIINLLFKTKLIFPNIETILFLLILVYLLIFMLMIKKVDKKERR